MDIINHSLFKQAYNASMDVSKFLDQYEMSKLLTGPYDEEGACVIIIAEGEDANSQIWAEKLLGMYTRWSEKHGYKGRVIERLSSLGIGFKFATIEFESEYAYGYLSGEAGVHLMIHSSLDGSVVRKTCSAVVDVIPLFLESKADVHMDETDLEISYASSHEGKQSGYEMEPVVSIRHAPTDTFVQGSGERSHFANKMKALNRLKAKLLVLAREQGVLDVNDIKKPGIMNALKQEARRYVFRPHGLVQDMKTGIQIPNLNSVLHGDIEPLIRAHISMRQGRDLE
uniref:Peptide chain release factor 2 n=2 Tax=Anthurium amnicola TaxID=1678845 RepID=A0A1D1Z1R0_9ARAE